MTEYFKTEFVKYYKEKLEPLGFIKVKGSHPYFVRVVNDEILHIFTYVDTKSTVFDYQSIQLKCGVATVYRKEINFSVPPKRNGDWLVSLLTVYEYRETEYPLISVPRDLMIYYYNDENLNEILEKTYDGAKIIMNELNKVLNMDEVLKYLLKHDAKNVTFRRGLDDSFFDEEGLYYTRNEFDYTKVDKIFETKRLALSNSLWSENEKVERLPLINEHEERMKEARLQFLSKDEDYKQGMDLLKKRYDTNISNLTRYGVMINKRELSL